MKQSGTARQFTLVNDSIATYGNSPSAFNTYAAENGGAQDPGNQHPPAILGWGYPRNSAGLTGEYSLFAYRTHQNGTLNFANCSLLVPIQFEGPLAGFGAFRIPNVRQFSQYVNGKFYDKVFYAPKDNIVQSSINGDLTGIDCFADPGEYCDRPSNGQIGDIPAWSSYCLSPAAMLSPGILGEGGATSPWDVAGGFRSPASSQCRFPDLKTRMLEHHWLQNRRAECNGNFLSGEGAYACEPYYFNHSRDSSPMTLFFDGHVESVGVRRAETADARIQTQSGVGLWRRDSGLGPFGYFSDLHYAGDPVRTSFHILTADGIMGRDVIGK